MSYFAYLLMTIILIVSYTYLFNKSKPSWFIQISISWVHTGALVNITWPHLDQQAIQHVFGMIYENETEQAYCTLYTTPTLPERNLDQNWLPYYSQPIEKQANLYSTFPSESVMVTLKYSFSNIAQPYSASPTFCTFYSSQSVWIHESAPKSNSDQVWVL